MTPEGSSSEPPEAPKPEDPVGPSELDLEPDEMRRAAREVADAVVERWARLREEPATRLADRETMEARLREDPPEEGRPLSESLQRFWADVEPFAGRIDHPLFFAFVPSSPTFASLMGEWLATGANFFAGTWIESAGPSQVELVVLDWLKEALGLPSEAAGILTSGGSAANLMGLAAAREAKLDGLPGEGVAYGSDQTHSAVARAFRILGFPDDRLRTLPSDDGWRLDPDEVADAVAEDRRRGLDPFCVVANAGTTNTGAIDPMDELAELCADEGLWLHVDGAYGATARLTERGRRLLQGMERADSLVLDPHKWLYVGYEAGCLLVRRPDALRQAFHVLPDYLQDTATQSGEVKFADYGLQLTRHARAVKLWVSLRTHGFGAMRREVERSMARAERLEAEARVFPELEVVSPASLGIVCLRYTGDGPDRRPANSDSRAARSEARAVEADDGGEIDPESREATLEGWNRDVVEHMQAEGRFMLSSTRLRGRYVIRLCPMNYRTREEDLEAVLREIVGVGRRVERGEVPVAGGGAGASGERNP